jgi:hypothetical protein
VSATAREGLLPAAPRHSDAAPATLPSMSGGPTDDAVTGDDHTEEAAPEAEDEVDEAGEESFPASDAPASWSGPPDS